MFGFQHTVTVKFFIQNMWSFKNQIMNFDLTMKTNFLLKLSTNFKAKMALKFTYR